MIDARSTRSLAGRLLVCSLLASFAIAGGGRSAFAQQVEGGATQTVATYLTLGAPSVRGVDSASDPSGNYLTVGGQGVLGAVCVNSQGNPFTGVITINATPSGYASFPRAVYSGHVNGGAGGFLVVWAEATAGPDGIRSLFARVVSCSAGLVGAAQTVTTGIWWEPGNLAVAYSPASQRFFVAWQTQAHTVQGSLLDVNGEPVGPIVFLSSGLGRDPSVTWNSVANEFGVSFSTETFSAFAVVPPGNPAGFTRNSFNIVPGILTTMTDVAFNPSTGRYVMSWYELSTGNFAKTAEFDSNANLLGLGVVSTKLGSYDAFSMAHNAASGTFLLVGVNRTNDTVLGLELNSRGFPFNGENTLSATTPIRYPRVSGSKNSKTWNVVFSGPSFTAITNVIAQSFASGGGPSGFHGDVGTPTPPPPSSGCTTVQPGPDWTCVNGNWLPPSTSPPPPPPPTGGCTTPQPGPGWVCVNGGWLPPDTAPPPPPPTSSCTTPQPGPGWICVNGGWLPPDLAPPPSSSCTTAQPGPGWVCVNGNWLPPDLAPPPPSSCTSVQPGPGWVCVNGNWLPPDLAPAPLPAPSGCTTPQPGSGWVCINGNWLPPDQACVGSAPAPGWVCVGGGWVPPDHPLVTGGGD